MTTIDPQNTSGAQAEGNTERFTGLAEAYQKYRPDYPAEALVLVREYWAATPGVPRILADVGAGTGISTRAMLAVLSDPAEDAWSARVVEPNDDMRAQAEILSLWGETIPYCNPASPNNELNGLCSKKLLL